MHSAKKLWAKLKDWQDQRAGDRVLDNYKKEYGPIKPYNPEWKSPKRAKLWDEAQEAYDRQRKNLDDYYRSENEAKKKNK